MIKVVIKEVGDDAEGTASAVVEVEVQYSGDRTFTISADLWALITGGSEGEPPKVGDVRWLWITDDPQADPLR